MALRVAAAVLGLALTALPTGAQTFRRGALTDPVVSTSHPDQRAVVYLPSGFDPARPTPILYVMDYRGRARLAAEVFQPAAERLGWIVWSSYNSFSDGELLPNLVALQAMWADSHAHFAVDDRRTYLAGASGTARIATLVARRFEGTFTGVIGAAAGFHPDAPPTAATGFLYYGAAGQKDYNFWEMQLLERRLVALELPSRVEYFPGGHAWMSPAVAGRALDWFELYAMRAGQRPIDEAYLAHLWARDESWADALEQDGRLLDAARRRLAMSRDYQGLMPDERTRDAAERAAAISRTAGARAQARSVDRGADRHAFRITEVMAVLTDAYLVGASAPTTSVGATLRALGLPHLREARAGQDEEAALAATRILAELSVQTGFYLPVEALRLGEDARADFYLDIALAIEAEDAFAWYLKAMIHARHRRADAAMAALERAVALGFSTIDGLEHDPAFARLRSLPSFVAIIERLRDGRGQPAGGTPGPGASGMGASGGVSHPAR